MPAPILALKEHDSNLQTKKNNAISSNIAARLILIYKQNVKLILFSPGQFHFRSQSISST